MILPGQKHALARRKNLADAKREAAVPATSC